MDKSDAFWHQFEKINDKVTKAGIAAKRKKAGWYNDYLLDVLNGF